MYLFSSVGNYVSNSTKEDSGILLKTNKQQKKIQQSKTNMASFMNFAFSFENASECQNAYGTSERPHGDQCS